MANIKVELFANAHNNHIPEIISDIRHSLYERDIGISEKITGTIIDLNWSPKEGDLMTEEEKSPNDKIKASPERQLLRLLLRYALETLTSLCIFGLFLVGSWLARLLGRCFDIQEYRLLLKLVEIAILVLGALLCIYSIYVATFAFARDIWIHFFPKKAKPKGDSK